MRIASGFTLIELVMVIVILGVVGTGTFSFISSSTQIFVDVTARDQLLSEGRFVVERLNRELRMSVPNSVRTLPNGSGSESCVEMLPTQGSAVYLDIPVAPESASNLVEAVAAVQSGASSAAEIIVYPTSPAEVYQSVGKRYAIDSVAADVTDSGGEDHYDTDGEVWDITLSSSVNFTADSPARRYFLASSPITYCAELNATTTRYDVYRYTGYSIGEAYAVNSTKVLMGEGISNATPFTYQPANLRRGALVNAYFAFARDNGETFSFNNDVHIPNAP